MSQKMLRLLTASAALACGGSAMADVLNITAPVITNGNREVLGPRSRFTFTVVDNGAAPDLGSAEMVTAITLIGLDSSGNAVTTPVNAAYNLVNGQEITFPTTNGDGSLGTQTVNLSATTNDDFVFTAPGVTHIRVRVTTAVNSVETIFNAADEGADQCFDVDITPPTITNVFRQPGNDNTFFIVFSESLSLNGIGANVAANETDPANVTEADLEVRTGMVFAGMMAMLSDQTFLSNNSIIRFDVAGTDDVGVGAVVRAGTTTDITDAVGNRIGNQTPGNGVTVTAPPAFSASRAEWVQAYTSRCGQGQTFRVVFTNPLASAGDSTFYQGPGDGNLTRGGQDSDISFCCGTTIDPNNASAVLIDIDCCSCDQVWPDGRDFFGSQYSWTFVAGTGTAPTDIFGSTLQPPPPPLPVGDAIRPRFQFVSFHDLNGDGKLDAAGIVYDEPVTTTAGAANFTLTRTDATVQPFQQITAEGRLTNDLVVADSNPANNNVPIGSLSIGNARLENIGGLCLVGCFDNENVPPVRLRAGNTVLLNYNPDAINWDNVAGNEGSATEAIPGTGGPSALILNSTLGITARDASGNETASGPITSESVNTDRAPAIIRSVWFLTGDNMDPGSSDQLLNEQESGCCCNDLDPGDDLFNNRLVFVGSESWGGAVTAGNVTESQVGFGPGGINQFPDDCCGGFSFGGVGGMDNNLLTFLNGNESPALVAGVLASIRPGSNIVDGSGNETTLTDTASTNRTAPYIPFIVDVNGGITHSAFLEDTNNDQFANQIRLTFTQPIDPATVQTTDFTLNLGTITGVSVTGNDVVLTITDGVVSMNNTVTITYNSNNDTTRIASLASAGGTGVAVSQTVPSGPPNTTGCFNDGDNVFEAQRIAPSDRPTQELAFMDIWGEIRMGGQPVPPGTKVYGMIAVPQIYQVRATHNNATFVVDVTNDTSSIQAWNNWLMGIREFVYLGRDRENLQFYRNFKDIGDTSSGDSTRREVIQLNISASTLTNITFTGRGESASETVANGRVLLAWDVLRADDGRVQNLYRQDEGAESFTGEPIRSEAVVTGTDGVYRLHMSAPAAVFTGLSRLSGVDRPVILVVELPTGRRFAASSVLTSVNGAPLRFRHQSRSQASGNVAPDSTTFHINLDNIGTEPVYEGWNLVPFNRRSGFAATPAARPVRVDGVSEGDIVVPGTSNPALPFTGALEQFVFFADDNGDGMWTRSENFNFDGIIVDPDFLRHFAFTMTSAGVQIGSGINNLVGGYAFAMFLAGDFYENLGCFQFGPVLTGNTLFSGATPATSFPNNATTQGWGLFTSKAAFANPMDIRSTNNPKLDFIFLFRNNGPNAAALNRTTIEVSSLDLLPGSPGGANINDTRRIDAGQAFFGHWQP